jgi:DNA-binding NarL/FixJ family response regulator
MPYRFLLIDDDPRIRARLRELLEAEYPGAAVVEAGNAEDGAAQVEGTSAVLLDVNLHGTSGIAALPVLRARAPLVPVVMVTTAPQDQYRSAALRAGASGFVGKARVYEDLAAVLGPLLAAGRPGTPVPAPALR